MQDKFLYEYAILRLVPRVDREEFINIGVVVFCKNLDFLGVKINMEIGRVQALYPLLLISEVEAYLHAFERIAAGEKKGGPIAELDVPSRFRWLTAKRSTVVQISPIHSGFSSDVKETLDALFEDMVC